MKSISLVHSNSIRNHPTNNSTAKNAFMFPKTQRFPDPNPQCKVPFYSNDSQLSLRKTSFGFGSKADFTKTTALSPAPNNYNIKSSTQIIKEKGKSFGLSRDSSPDKSYLIPQLQKVPGPGNYQNEKNKTNDLKYSMRKRTIDFIESKISYKNNPGPGKYSQIDLDPKSGRFSVAKFSDAKLSKINPKTQRFETIKETPGPLNYNHGDNLSKQGKYVLSNHRSNGARVFSHDSRITFTDRFKTQAEKVPGPGDYNPPSQFGVYGDYNYYKKKGVVKQKK